MSRFKRTIRTLPAAGALSSRLDNMVHQPSIIAIIILACQFAFGSFPAKAGDLVLRADTVVENVFDHMRFVPAEAGALEDHAGRLRAIENGGDASEKNDLANATVPDGGWATVLLVNESSTFNVWRLDTERTFTTGFQFFLDRQETSELVLNAGYPPVPLEQRESGDRYFASTPVILPPGGTAHLWVRLDWGELPRHLSIRMEPELLYIAQRVADTGWDAGFLMAGAVFLGFFVAFARLLRSLPALAYATFFAGLLIFHAVRQGHLEWLATGLSAGDLIGWIRPLQALIVVSYLTFIASFLDTRERFTWLHRMIVILAIVTPTLALVEMTVPYGWVPLAVPGIVVSFAAVSAWGAWVAVRAGLPGSRLFALGVAILFGYVLFNMFAPVSTRTVTLVTIAAQLLDASIFAAAIVRQTFALRASRDRAMKAELELTRDKLRLSDDLLRAGENLERARDLAQRRKDRLAMTGHDLRQPLNSLNLALERASSEAPELETTLSASLDYLRDILDDTVDENAPVPLSSTGEEEPELLALQTIFDNAGRMFAAEAREKDLDLRIAPSSLHVKADAVALIRIVSNLLSNAIRYTADGAILLGARRRDGACAIEVWDTGPGLSDREIDAIAAPGVRGDAGNGTKGAGLGLASVSQLAATMGATLQVDSVAGRGSRFSVEGLALPKAIAAAA